jgi:hypothetical protein
MIEETGPYGEKQGANGTISVQLAIAGATGQWTTRPAKMIISEGFLDRVEDLPCKRGPFGATVSLYCAENLNPHSGRLVGDVVRYGWVDGQLLEKETLATAVEFQPTQGKN